MAIPRVNLNVDPLGYAGSIVRGIPTYAAKGQVEGAGGGMLPGIGDFLNRIMKSREALAEAQLRMMKEELAGAKERRLKEQFAVQPTRGGVTAVDPAKEMQYMLLQNLKRAGGQPLNMQDWAGKQSARGMAGLIGGILSGQTGHANIGGMIPKTPEDETPTSMAARGMVFDPETGGYVPRATPSGYTWIPPEAATRTAIDRPWEIDVEKYQGRAGLGAAQRRTGKPVRRGSYSITGTPQEGPTRGELGGYRKGGTIPRTGTYRLHKGELVMSPEDVEQNPDMVARLIRQKLTERIRKGRAKGSYQGGSIQEELIRKAFEGDMVSLREVLRGTGVAEPEIDRVVNQVTRSRGKIIPKTARIQNIKDYFQGELAPYAGGPGIWEGERLAAELEGGPKLLPGQKLLGPGRVIEGMPPPTPVGLGAGEGMPPRWDVFRVSFRDAFRGSGLSDVQIDELARKAFEGKSTAGSASARLAEAAGTAAKVGGGAIPPGALDDAIRTAAKRGGGFRGKLAAAAAIPAGLAALYMLARETPSAPKEPAASTLGERWPPEAILGGVPGRMIPKLGAKGVGEALGEAIREQISGLSPRVVGEALGETGFMRGLVGPGGPLMGIGAEPPTEGGELQEAPAALQEQALAPPGEAEPAEGSIEAALARVREGDLGTPEKPLVLRGELSEMEQAQRDIEAIPAYQEARRKAEKAGAEADKIFTLLSREGGAIDPEVYTDLYREGERKMKLADKFQAIADRRETASEAYLSSTAKALTKLTHDIELEREKQAGRLGLEEARGKRILTAAMVRPYASSLPKLYAIAATGSPQQRARAQQEIAEILMAVVSVTRPDATPSKEDAAKWAEQYADMSPEDARALAQAMLAQLRD